VDGESSQLVLPPGSNVRQALEAAGVEVGPLDRSEPTLFAELVGGEQIRVIRVVEEFEVEQNPLSFVSRTLQNESLAAGEQRLIQNGVNGLQESTYRLLYEDGALVSRTLIRETVITAPVEEIIMVGAQSPYSSIPISGRLAFLSAGNAWLLESETGSRRAVVTTGDLDGRVFEISPDRAWLLFTRQSRLGGEINTLWVASLNEDPQQIIDLGVGNIVHYAGWVPGASPARIAFSAVEPSLNPPGWQAKNDLQFITFNDGEVSLPSVALAANQEGFYSWWGSTYAWSPDGEKLAFARPDAVGLVNVNSAELDVQLPLPTFQTGSDWAWMPSLSWSPDGNVLYTVEHAEQQGLEVQEQSPIFNLVAIDVGSGDVSTIAENIGMFAGPVPDPDGGQVAFLRAFTPSQSDISAYELMVVAPSGNMLSLFPPQGAAGLHPQRVAWSPSAENGPMIAFVYQGNLWIANVLSGEAHQVTGDGLVAALSWR